jgi:sterol desaturase/sphingolipid hydroxylase (fatty acid hydroxylase superfamily)
MKSWLLDHPEYVIVGVSVALFVLAMCIEGAIRLLRGWQKVSAGDYATNLTLYVGSLVIDFFWLPVVYSIFTWLKPYALFQMGYEWWHWALLFVLDDLCYYWFHRSSHRFWLLWASHENHHASPFFNLSVAARQTWTPFLAFTFWLPLVLLGFEPWMVLTMQLLSLTYQSFLHTELLRNFGALEWVINSPSHHRVHHGAEAPYVDRNFGGTLIIWDRLFGSFTAECSQVRYGTDSPLSGYQPIRAAFAEWGRYARFLVRSSPLSFWQRCWARPGGES